METGIIEVAGPPARFYLTPVPAQYVFDRGLRPEAIIGELIAGPEKIDPENLRENEIFAKFLCWVIAKHAGGNQALLTEAARIGTGSVKVIDLRFGDRSGPVPDEDIFGAFDVKDGQLNAFYGNRAHKALGPAGLMKLDAYFESKLLEELRALPEVETGKAPSPAPAVKPWWKFW